MSNATNPMNDEVVWICPNCSTENTDLKSQTSAPLCSNCEKDFEWQDIWHVSDDYSEYLNLVDDLSKEKYGKPAIDLTEFPEDALYILQEDFANGIRHEIALSKVAKLAGIQ